jgi:hypothetical protein
MRLQWLYLPMLRIRQEGPIRNVLWIKRIRSRERRRKHVDVRTNDSHVLLAIKVDCGLRKDKLLFFAFPGDGVSFLALVFLDLLNLSHLMH